MQQGIAPSSLRDDDLVITEIGAALRIDEVVEQAGEGGQIVLNVKCLGEALTVIGTPQVAFEMVTAQAPGVLWPVGQNGYVHLIMPMALR